MARRVTETRIGTVLGGKYRLDRVIGEGGMAAVFAATHRNLKCVAVKMLHPEYSRDPETCTRFLREGYIANSVKHPGAVDVLDDDVAEDGSAYLVMELLEGRGLEEIWEANGCRLPIDVALHVGVELLDVLSAAHASGVVHRDIKPANLFLTTDGTLKVLDFGIARLRTFSTGGGTATGSLLGTPGFMAPEQARGRTDDIDARTDLWAVGATIFTLICGEFVHNAETPMEVLLQTVALRARSFATVAPQAPPAVIEVLDRALAYERESRWQDAAEMRAAVLKAYVAMQGQGPSSDKLAPYAWQSEQDAPRTQFDPRIASSTPYTVKATTPNLRPGAPTHVLLSPPTPVAHPARMMLTTGRAVTAPPAMPATGATHKSSYGAYIAIAAAVVGIIVGRAIFMHNSSASAQHGGPPPPASTAVTSITSAPAPPAPAPLSTDAPSTTGTPSTDAEVAPAAADAASPVAPSNAMDAGDEPRGSQHPRPGHAPVPSNHGHGTTPPHPSSFDPWSVQ